MSGWEMPPDPPPAPRRRRRDRPRRPACDVEMSWGVPGTTGPDAGGDEPAQVSATWPARAPGPLPGELSTAVAARRGRVPDPLAWGGAAPQLPTGPLGPGEPISSVPQADPTPARPPQLSGGWTAAQNGWSGGTPAAPGAPVVRTGPSGLLLGEGAQGPVSIRLFQTTPTRVLLAVPDYVVWLLAYRCISLGAHLSVLAQDARRWRGLADAVRSAGGTADILGPGQAPPTAGRPYRPSVVVDDADFYDGLQQPLGPWQALLMTSDITTSSAVFALRNCDMALVSPFNDKVAENLRRAHALSSPQLAQCRHLQEHEVALAMPRRLLKVAVPPTRLEYQQLFA